MPSVVPRFPPRIPGMDIASKYKAGLVRVMAGNTEVLDLGPTWC